MRLDRAPGWPAPGTPGIAWLGQAGFWIETGAARVLIDPYMSDSLARKYAGQANDHRRMMPPPILPGDLPRPDVVLVTHAHTDHMDPDTLAPLASRFPGLPFLVPAARLEVARTRIGASAQLVPVDAGARLEIVPGLRIDVLPAAHETLERDGDGRHVHLGYGISAGDLRFYHSGDCVPFDGLEPAVAALRPDVLLLPVNGRDALRRAAGVPGNFTLDEAVDLARHVGAGFLVPHHFGMFAFNTCEPAVIDRIAAATHRPRILRPVAGETLTVRLDEGYGDGNSQNLGG